MCCPGSVGCWSVLARRVLWVGERWWVSWSQSWAVHQEWWVLASVAEAEAEIGAAGTETETGVTEREETVNP